jgi:hypothetical protein
VAVKRRSDRASWPVRVFGLGDEPGDSLVHSTTPEERLAMMWPLTLSAWALAGKPLPDYERRHMPVRYIAPEER